MELPGAKVKRMHFIKNKPKFDENSEEKSSSKKKRSSTQEKKWSSTQDQQEKKQKEVRFDERIQYYYYEETDEDHREILYNRFIKDLWRKHNEVTKQLEQFSLLQENQVAPRQQMLVLVSILEKLQHQEKRIINCLSETPEPLEDTEEEITIQKEDNDFENTSTIQRIERLPHNKDEQTDDNDKPVEIIYSMTAAQKIILASTEKSSTPHLMTELEIVRKEIGNIINEAVENRYSLAVQLTNDNTKSKELVKLTSSKRINNERKWDKIIERVGGQRAENMKNYIKEIDEESQIWWKERQEKISQAEDLMITVNKERSARRRVEMVTQRPELSREIVIVEAAKILSFIEVKRPQNATNLDQWLNEQNYMLTSKLGTALAKSVMQEVYDKLPTEDT